MLNLLQWAVSKTGTWFYWLSSWVQNQIVEALQINQGFAAQRNATKPAQNWGRRSYHILAAVATPDQAWVTNWSTVILVAAALLFGLKSRSRLSWRMVIAFSLCNYGLIILIASYQLGVSTCDSGTTQYKPDWHWLIMVYGWLIMLYCG